MNTDVSDEVSVEDRRICAKCISESYLSVLISEGGVRSACHYCGRRGSTISIMELSNHVERAIDQHFQVTSIEPEGYEYFLQREHGNWERAGERVGDVISEILMTSEAVAEDVRDVLDERTSDPESAMLGEEQPFESDAQYEEISIVDYSVMSKEYRRFEELVVDRARYFSPETRNILSTLFDRLEHLKVRDGHSILVEAGPGHAITGFFRARVFQSNDPLVQALIKPDQELGPPPPRTGRAGRLNAVGVSIFYGADDVRIALAEVRPPVGSRAVVARFELVRPIRLLDIGALRSLLVRGSVFDPEYLARLRHAAFLDSFGERFAQPIMPDHEASEYIPTQAIADYLANEVKPALDGLLYASSQSVHAGKNVALFHASSRVEPLMVQEGMTLDVSTGSHSEDGFEVDYTIFEEVPETVRPARRPPRSALPSGRDGTPGSDERTPTLRIDPDSLVVHHIRAVEVGSDPHKVNRFRHAKGKPDF
jgi:hypothetical protein